MEVTLIQMLDAREARAQRQQTLISEFSRPLLCFSMNIAGPVKNSPLIRRGFRLGRRLLEQQLAVVGADILHFEEEDAVTGCECIYVLDCDPLRIKSAAVTVEDHTAAGRLYDMDVIRPDGTKVERGELGFGERRCLICGENARGCARSRTHTVAELQNATASLLCRALREADCAYIAELACRALLYEVAATPKPGLVDRQNSGSHADMDFFTFQRSAAALWPYFARCAEIGMDMAEDAPEHVLQALRAPGLLAEGEMRRATGGVNTHKGAIFSLGIACAALGMLPPADRADPERVCDQCARMAKGLVAADFAGLTGENARTAGQKLYLQYGITGVRGQAEAGFPAALAVGLPHLEAGLARGLSLNDAGCAALLAMMAAAVDTNLITRGGFAEQQRVARETAELLKTVPYPDRRTLEGMNDAFVARRLSPGGTADLLALTYLLHFLKEEPHV